VKLGGGARQWTAEVRAWPWACPLFLFFATGLGASSIRYGVPAFPLIWSFVERTDSEVDRKVQLAFALGLAAGGLIAQWMWNRNVTRRGWRAHQAASFRRRAGQRCVRSRSGSSWWLDIYVWLKSGRPI
jgi:hypothetical protein